MKETIKHNTKLKTFRWPAPIIMVVDNYYQQNNDFENLPSLIEAIKKAYENLPENEKDYLVPVRADVLAKDDPISYNNNGQKAVLAFNYNWPSNGGFVDDWEVKELKYKMKCDRLGNPSGTTFALLTNPPASYNERSLPYYIEKKYANDIKKHPAYRVYEATDLVINTQINIKTGKTAPCFGYDGGSVQITRCDEKGNSLTDKKDEELYTLGYLTIVRGDEEE